MIATVNVAYDRGVLRAIALLVAVSAACGGGQKKPASPPPERCASPEACKRGCDAGHGESCLDLGARFHDGKGVANDAATELSSKACELGNIDGCELAGRLYANGEPPFDEAKAIAFFGKACAIKRATSCTYLGTIFATRGNARDVARALPLLDAGCDGGDVLGCHALAYVYETGLGVAVDAARAATYYKKACKLDEKCAKGGATRAISGGR